MTEIFPFAPGSGPAQPPIQCVSGVLLPAIKQPGYEADHSHPSRVEVKNAWSYTSSPQYVFMVWYLVKHRRFIIVLTRVPTPIMEPEGSCRIHKSAPIPWPCVTFRNKLFS